MYTIIYFILFFCKKGVIINIFNLFYTTTGSYTIQIINMYNIIYYLFITNNLNFKIDKELGITLLN